MFCPQCRHEYKEGIVECHKCVVPLVNELPPMPYRLSNHRLKTATVWLIIASCYIFLSRTLATFFLELFRYPLVARVSVMLSFFASFAALFFFVYFYRDYIQKEHDRLRMTTLLVIISSVMVVLLHAKGILIVFQIYISPHLTKPLLFSYHFEPIIPWLGGIFILLFFIVFYKKCLLMSIKC